MRQPPIEAPWKPPPHRCGMWCDFRSSFTLLAFVFTIVLLLGSNTYTTSYVDPNNPCNEAFLQILILADSITLPNSSGEQVDCADPAKLIWNTSIPQSNQHTEIIFIRQSLYKILSFVKKIPDSQIFNFKPRQSHSQYANSRFVKSLNVRIQDSFWNYNESFFSFYSLLKIRKFCFVIAMKFFENNGLIYIALFSKGHSEMPQKELTLKYLYNNNGKVASDKDFVHTLCISGVSMPMKIQSLNENARYSTKSLENSVTVNFGTKIGCVCLISIEGVAHAVLVTNRVGASVSPYTYDFPASSYDGSSNLSSFCVQEMFEITGIFCDVLATKMLIGPNFEAIMLCFAKYSSGSPTDYGHQVEAVHFIPVSLLPKLMVSGLPEEVMNDVLDKVRHILGQHPPTSLDYLGEICDVKKIKNSPQLIAAASLSPEMKFFKSFLDNILNSSLNNNFIKTLKFYEKSKISGLGSIKLLWVLLMLALVLVFLIAVILVSFTRTGAKFFKNRYY